MSKESGPTTKATVEEAEKIITNLNKRLNFVPYHIIGDSFEPPAIPGWTKEEVRSLMARMYPIPGEK